MNELFSIKNTPGNARRVIAVSELYGFSVPDELRELANTDTVTTDSVFRDTIQMIVDWEYRSTVSISSSSHDAFIQDLVEYLVLSGERVLLTYSTNKTLLEVLERMKRHRTVSADLFAWVRMDQIDGEFINENADRILIDISNENSSFFAELRPPVAPNFIRSINVVNSGNASAHSHTRMAMHKKTHHYEDLNTVLFTGTHDWLKFSNRSGFKTGATARDYYKAIGISVVS